MNILRKLSTKKAVLPILVLLTILMLPTLTFADCTKASPIDASTLSSLPLLDVIDCPWDKKTIDTPIADAKMPQAVPSMFRTILGSATSLSFRRNTFTPRTTSGVSIRTNTPKTVQALLSQCRHRIVGAFSKVSKATLDLTKLTMNEINHEVLSLEYDGWMDVIDIRGEYVEKIANEGKNDDNKQSIEYPVSFQLGIYFEQPFTSCDQMNVSLQI